MNNTKLFNSKTDPIPRIRPDLDIIPVRNNGNSYLYFHDVRGFITDDFALEYGARNVLSLLDGRKSINELKPYLGKGVNTSQLLKFVHFLDENCLLYSPYFKGYAEQREQEYENSAVHQSITAGGSYPADPEELRSYLDEAFVKYGTGSLEIEKESVKALYAPHIDPRVGMKSYVQSFQILKELKPKQVVILATSHYAGLYANIYKNKPFVLSDKNYEMPLGTIPADREAINQLMQHGNALGLSDHDRALRIEHSIELHLLFLQYIWDHTFSIVPIVVGGLEELFYVNGTHLSRQIDQFAKQLRQQFGDDEETLFLISGDLAHVGKKFGDNQPAAAMQNEVDQFDHQFLKAVKYGSTDRMLQLMKRNYDSYRICGFPPLYTFLKAFRDLKGQTISYDRWDQTEQESAVTFGSILYK